MLINLEKELTLNEIICENPQKVTCLYFSASWCGPCKKIYPELEELYSKIFTSGKNVFAFDMGISKMVSEASNQEFDRSTILMVLGIAFLKYF